MIRILTRAYLVLLLTQIISTLILAQSCVIEELSLTTQEEIDDFALRHPLCKSVAGDVKIEEKSAGSIVSLKSLSQITNIQGALIINGNRNLVDLQGLDQVIAVKSLQITANASLQDLQALKSLATVTQSLRIANNLSLQSVLGLDQITQILGDLSISDNDLLVSLEGLKALQYVGEHLIITSNASLLNLEGLENLEAVGQELFIKDNLTLQSVQSLAGLTKIGRSLMFDNNPELESLNGLENLISIGGNLLIANNQSLIDLTGLRQMRKMEGILQLFNNPSIRSLSGLDSIDHRGIADLALLSSPELSDCSVTSICDYLREETGTVAILMTAEGCLNIEEILSTCPRGGPNSTPGLRSDNIFFPNPTSGIVFIKRGPYKGASYNVTDTAGRLMAHGIVIQDQIDLGNMSAGMFIIELLHQNQRVREGVIKIE